MWVERGLPPPDEEAVSVHLAACDDCRRAATIAFLSSREAPASLGSEGERQVLLAVQGALARPSSCLSENLLAAWLQDGLPVEGRAKVTEHLAGCDECRRAMALARMSGAEPVSALSQVQERRAIALVLKTASREAFFSFSRVAAAAILVGIAATYLSTQWTARPPTREISTVAGPSDETMLRVDPARPSSPSPPDKKAPEGKGPDAEPVPVERPTPESKPGDPAPESPSRFAPVAVHDWEGEAPAPADGRIAIGDLVKADRVTSMNLEGRAQVVLDGGCEARLASAPADSSLVYEASGGRGFIDTVGSQQRWEIRKGARVMILDRFRGRAAVMADGEDLRVLILRGGAEIGADRFEAGCSLLAEAEGGVGVKPGGDEIENLSGRYDAIRPKSFLVFRGAAGATSMRAPWKFSSPGRVAAPHDSPQEKLVPDGVDPIHWVKITLDEPVQYVSDMALRIACSGSGTKIYLWADGWYREVARKGEGSGTEEWLLKGLRKEMVDLVAGEPLRKFMIGVVQEGGKPRTLEVDAVEIRRILE